MSRKLVCHPLTPDRWADFEQLFGANGACGGCWCMFWRLPRSEFQAGKYEGNQAAFTQIVLDGGEPGVLAYQGRQAVGWCAVAPREDRGGVAFHHVNHAAALPPGR